MARAVQRASEPLEVTLPASSANLGPAFDCCAVALRLYFRVRAAQAEAFSVHASGRDPEVCGALEGNLLLDTYRELLAAGGQPVIPLSLHIRNEIPVGKGCGSSAAARVAAALLAAHFGQLDWPDDRILKEAILREGHADNAAACWLGGLVIAHHGNGNLSTTQLRLPTWPLLLALPPQRLRTDQARAVLPEFVSRADAVENVHNAMLLVAACLERRTDLIERALRDRLHEPYREPLCPLLGSLQPLAGQHGILGCALSGAGPSVLMVLDPKAQPTEVQKRVRRHLEQCGLDAELLLTTSEPPRAVQRRRIWKR